VTPARIMKRGWRVMGKQSQSLRVTCGERGPSSWDASVAAENSCRATRGPSRGTWVGRERLTVARGWRDFPGYGCLNQDLGKT
jgi:hypothetical protein